MQFSALPWWRRIVLIALAPIVLLISFAALVLILLPVAIWNGLVTSAYWLRNKLTGTAIPPKGPWHIED